MPTIEQLELEIQSKSTSAVTGIDTLSASLTKLKTSLKGGVGLTSVAKQLRNLDAALKSIDSSSSEKIDKLANSLEKLKNLGNIKISSSIANQLKGISIATNALNEVDFTNVEKLSNILQPLNDIDKSSGLKSTINSLNKLPQVVQTLNNIDWKIFTSQIQQLSTALTPLSNQLNTVATSFSRLPSNIQRTVTATNRITQENSKAANSYMNLWAKINLVINATKHGARTIASWITQSNQYIEDLNLFNTSMGQYAAEAQNYAEAVSEALGIDPGEFMRNQGVFNTIISGFGVASDKAYLMSKNLTQLGYDIASFFNISFEDAMQKLQSGIAGELEPLRRLGYDLSVARLQEEALALGIEKKVSAMTQAEKSQLRYYAIMTQVTTAQGDMARTLNAPANQLRVLQAQVTQCARALGNIFIPALNSVLPYVIALSKIVRKLAEYIASLFGFKLPEVDYSTVNSAASSISDSMEDANNSLEESVKNAKKLKKCLLAMDELNILSVSNTSSDDSDSSNENDLGFKLPEYDFLGNLIGTQIDDIISKIKEWLGLNQEINSLADFLHTRLGHILIVVGSIGLGFLAWKLSNAFMNGLITLQNLLKGTADKGKTLAIGIALTVTGIALEGTAIWEAITEGLNGQNLAQMIIGAGSITIGGALIGKALGSSIIGAAISAIVAGVPMMITGIWDAISNGLNWLNAALIAAGSTLSGAGIGAIIGACGGPIGAGIGALIGLVVGGLTDLVILIVQNWDTIMEWCGNVCNTIGQFFVDLWSGISNTWNTVAEWFNTNVIQPISNFFSGLWNGITSTAQNCWNGIVSVFSPVIEFFTNLFNNVSQTISDIFYNIGVIVSGCWETIQLVWSVTSEWFNTNVIQPIGNLFSGLWDTICNIFSPICDWFKDIFTRAWEGIKFAWDNAVSFFAQIWSGIQGAFSHVTDWFKNIFTKAWEGIKNVFSIGGKIFDGIKDGILNAFKFVVNGIIDGLNWVIAQPFNGINWALEKIKGVDIFGLKPFDGIRTISVPEIPKLAKGGLATAPVLAMVGDNPNASSDPEVISPLSELQKMISKEQQVNTTNCDEQTLNILQRILYAIENQETEYINNTYLDYELIDRKSVKVRKRKNRRYGGVAI